MIKALDTYIHPAGIDPDVYPVAIMVPVGLLYF